MSNHVQLCPHRIKTEQWSYGNTTYTEQEFMPCVQSCSFCTWKVFDNGAKHSFECTNPKNHTRGYIGNVEREK